MKLFKLLILALVTASALTATCSVGCAICSSNGCHWCHKRAIHKVRKDDGYDYYECRDRHSIDPNCLFYGKTYYYCQVCKKGWYLSFTGLCVPNLNADSRCAVYGSEYIDGADRTVCKACEYSVVDSYTFKHCVRSSIPKNCMLAYSSSWCNLCEPGYTLITNSNTE